MIARIIVELLFRHRVPLLLQLLIALLAVWTGRWPRRFPSFALPWLLETALCVCIFVGEWTTGRLRSGFRIEVVEAIDTATRLLAADVDVETEGCEGGDTNRSELVMYRT